MYENNVPDNVRPSELPSEWKDRDWDEELAQLKIDFEEDPDPAGFEDPNPDANWDEVPDEIVLARVQHQSMTAG